MKLIKSLRAKMRFGRFGIKQLLILAIALELVGAAGVVAYGFVSGSRAMGAELAYVQGKVEYRETPDKPWLTAEADMLVQQGMGVRVVGSGRAVIALDDGSAVRLNDDSTVLLTKLTYKHVLLHNDGGQVYTRVTASDSRTFEVTTSKSTYRSMGTAYRTINTPDKEGVEVYHSRVNVLGTTVDGVVVKQGEQYYQIDKNNPDQAKKVTELDRTALAADSFIAWNGTEDSKEFRSELGTLFDLKPPSLQVSEPANGLATAADSVEVNGTTETGAKVLVNGIAAVVAGNTFAHTVALAAGANAITVEAADGAGNKTVATINVTKTTPVTAATTNSFTLRGTEVDSGISFTWTVSGYDTSKGFKLLMGSAANPTFVGSSEKVYIEKNTARSYTWKIQDGQTHNFRICTYTGSGCAVYSNNIAVTAPSKPESPSPTGSVTLNWTGGSNVAWDLDGTAPNGYKLVWNTTGNPTYPTSTGTTAQFYGPESTTGAITTTPGTYFVRLCLYKDGTCPIYSNPTITITVD